MGHLTVHQPRSWRRRKRERVGKQKTHTHIHIHTHKQTNPALLDWIWERKRRGWTLIIARCDKSIQVDAVVSK